MRSIHESVFYLVFTYTYFYLFFYLLALQPCVKRSRSFSPHEAAALSAILQTALQNVQEFFAVIRVDLTHVSNLEHSHFFVLALAAVNNVSLVFHIL